MNEFINEWKNLFMVDWINEQMKCELIFIRRINDKSRVITIQMREV